MPHCSPGDRRRCRLLSVLLSFSSSFFPFPSFLRSTKSPKKNQTKKPAWVERRSRPFAGPAPPACPTAFCPCRRLLRCPSPPHMVRDSSSGGTVTSPTHEICNITHAIKQKQNYFSSKFAQSPSLARPSPLPATSSLKSQNFNERGDGFGQCGSFVWFCCF